MRVCGLINSVKCPSNVLSVSRNAYNCAQTYSYVPEVLNWPITRDKSGKTITIAPYKEDVIILSSAEKSPFKFITANSCSPSKIAESMFDDATLQTTIDQFYNSRQHEQVYYTVAQLSNE